MEVTSFGTMGSTVETSEISTGAVTPAKLSFDPLWELLETISPGSATTIQDFATVLTGDTEFEYMIIAYLENATASLATITLRVNGATATASVQLLSVVGGTMSGSSNAGVNADVGILNISNDCLIKIHIPVAQSGNNKRFYQTVNSRDHSGLYQYSGFITTPSSATEITSLGLLSSIASSIDTGSILKLYRRAI